MVGAGISHCTEMPFSLSSFANEITQCARYSFSRLYLPVKARACLVTASARAVLFLLALN